MALSYAARDYRREDLVAARSRPGSSGNESLAHQPMTLGDQRGVPGRTILFVQGDQVAARRNPGGAAGIDEQHQREQHGDLTYAGRRVRISRVSRIALAVSS